MKFNINRPPKYIKAEERKQWHEAFAWTWKTVDRTDEGHAVIWFEKYMRRERIGPTNNMKNDDGRYWQQFSKKTYFKKKLNGDFDRDKNPWDGDVEKAEVGYNISSGQASSISLNDLKKAMTNSAVTSTQILDRIRKQSK